MSPHRVLVPLERGGTLHRIGDVIEFEGLDWKLEPIDPEQRKRWAKSTAEPARVEEIQARHAGYPATHARMLEQHQAVMQSAALPPSGPAASGAA